MTRPTFLPQAPADPGTPKYALQQLIEQLGGIQKAMVRFELGQSQTYAIANRNLADDLPWSKVCAATTHEAPACAELLAELAGGVFLPVTPRQEPLGTLTADTLKESTEACVELVRATVDGVLTSAEARGALPDLEEAVRAIVQLHAAVKQAAQQGGEKK